MNLLTDPVFTAFASGIFGALIGAVSGYLGRRQEAAPNIQKAWTEATASLIEQYTEALTSARAETAEMKREITELSARVEAQSVKIEAQSEKIEAQTEEIEALNGHIDVLTTTLERHGITPPARRRRVAVDLQAGGTA